MKIQYASLLTLMTILIASTATSAHQPLDDDERDALREYNLKLYQQGVRQTELRKYAYRSALAQDCDRVNVEPTAVICEDQVLCKNSQIEDMDIGHHYRHCVEWDYKERWSFNPVRVILSSIEKGSNPSTKKDQFRFWLKYKEGDKSTTTLLLRNESTATDLEKVIGQYQ